nr:ester cyclase [Pseudohalocynthiibacter aestuariivivens]
MGCHCACHSRRPVVGPDEFRAFAEALLAMIADVRIQIAHDMEDDDWLSVLIDVSARCRKQGTPISVTGQILVRMQDGKIAEGHSHLDYITLYEQLGMLPDGTQTRCMSGNAQS